MLKYSMQHGPAASSLMSVFGVFVWFCCLSPLCHSCATVCSIYNVKSVGIRSQDKSTPIIHVTFPWNKWMQMTKTHHTHTQTGCIHAWKITQLAHLNDHVQPCTYACSGKKNVCQCPILVCFNSCSSVCLRCFIESPSVWASHWCNWEVT